MNPASFTFELLNGLKFKELQKLSIKFNVNRRWAKKQELIENLLRLKLCDEVPKVDEWENGSLVFSNEQKHFNNEVIKNESANNNINNENGNVTDRRLTFTISRKVDLTSESQLNDANKNLSVSSLYDQSKITDSRASFEISSELVKFDKYNLSKPLTKEKPAENATLFFKNSYEPMTNRSGAYNKKGINLAPITTKTMERTLNKETKLNDINSTKKLKSSFLRRDDMGNKNMLNQHSVKLTKHDKLTTSKIPKKCLSNNIKITQKSSVSFKKNMFASNFENKNVAGKKCEDQKDPLPETTYQKSMTKPNPLVSSHLMLLNRSSCGVKNDSQISNLTYGSQQNHHIAKKMPDFKKIHERQFEKMDSIVDYLKKKEERSKKLIKGSDFKMHKSIEIVKTDIPLPKNNGSSVNKKLLESKNNAFARAVEKENVKSKIPFLKHRTEDIRDKNRKLIQGVRTNKRFELQMKLRNV